MQHRWPIDHHLKYSNEIAMQAKRRIEYSARNLHNNNGHRFYHNIKLIIELCCGHVMGNTQSSHDLTHLCAIVRKETKTIYARADNDMKTLMKKPYYF